MARLLGKASSDLGDVMTYPVIGLAGPPPGSWSPGCPLCAGPEGFLHCSRACGPADFRAVDALVSRPGGWPFRGASASSTRTWTAGWRVRFHRRGRISWRGVRASTRQEPAAAILSCCSPRAGYWARGGAMGAILLVLAARARRHWRSRLRLPAHRPDGAGELRGVGQLPAAGGRGGDTVRRRHAGSPAGGERVAPAPGQRPAEGPRVRPPPGRGGGVLAGRDRGGGRDRGRRAAGPGGREGGLAHIRPRREGGGGPGGGGEITGRTGAAHRVAPWNAQLLPRRSPGVLGALARGPAEG